jgi:hypothetical protein
MSLAAIEAELEKLSLEEKLQAMERLWDELSRRPEAVPMPQWHQDLLDERERLLAEGRARFSDWEEAKKRISERTR